MTDKLIQTELLTLPESLKQQVLSYIRFLKQEQSKDSKNEAGKRRVFGIAKEKYVMAPDFAEPLEDFKEYMEWTSLFIPMYSSGLLLVLGN